MTHHLSRFFTHIFRTIENTPVRNNTFRRRLVPDKLSGKNAITVIYKVESHSRSKRIAQACVRLLQAISSPRTMLSNEEEAALSISLPEAVRGMTTLDRKLFSQTVSVPGIKVPSKDIGAVAKLLKKTLFKMQRIKPVAELPQDDPLCKSHKLFLLNQKKLQLSDAFSDESKTKLAGFGIDVTNVDCFDVVVGYENWTASEVLKGVLPEESDGVSSYSLIGHIAHLNLKPEVMDYKLLIGEVILDKTPSVKTVVNKLSTIDNTFRNFQMELLAGEDNFVTLAKENGCVFEMDFAKVYWNPRLSTEHQRVVDLLEKDDVLYDVFAGVGPFAVPAAKKGATVIANDLNPHSHAALVRNVKLNKVKAGRLTAHNLDGRDFIKTVLKDDLVHRLKGRAGGGSRRDDDLTDSGEAGTPRESAHLAQKYSSAKALDAEEAIKKENRVSLQKLYVSMNLPALALEFLDAYSGLLADFPAELQSHPKVLTALPTVLCYCFSKSDDPEADVRERAEAVMGRPLPAGSAVRSVRNVAPNKEMMCLVFPLSADILFAAQGNDSQDFEGEQPPTKKQKVAEMNA